MAIGASIVDWFYRSVPATYANGNAELPNNLLQFIFTTTGLHQALLSVLTIIVFLLDLAPLELQRRIVNGLVENSDYSLIVLLATG